MEKEKRKIPIQQSLHSLHLDLSQPFTTQLCSWLLLVFVRENSWKIPHGTNGSNDSHDLPNGTNVIFPSNGYHIPIEFNHIFPDPRFPQRDDPIPPGESKPAALGGSVTWPDLRHHVRRRQRALKMTDVEDPKIVRQMFSWLVVSNMVNGGLIV